MSLIGWACLISVSWATPRPLVVGPGEPALAFALSAVNEEVATETVNKVQVSLSDFTGMMPPHARKAVVVHFFSQGAGATELKALNRLHRRYANRGVQVIAISGDPDSKAALTDRIAALRLDFPVLRDSHRVVIGRYGISELPITLVVEGNGNVFAIGQPRGDDVETAVSAELQPLLER
jgi:peroxiredoxin